jgi:hypothetical protein
MEDLSRFTGPVGGSSRLAAYRARLNGQSAAQIGLAAALSRNSAPIAARTVPAVTTVTAKASPANHQSAKVDRAAIIQSANEAEKKRWATVLAHEASQGREKMAAHLLNWPHRFTASQIIAALQTTGNRAAQIGKAVNWEEARAEMLERTGRA